MLNSKAAESLKLVIVDKLDNQNQILYLNLLVPFYVHHGQSSYNFLIKLTGPCISSFKITSINWYTIPYFITI